MYMTSFTSFSKISKELSTYESRKEARSKTNIAKESNGLKDNVCEICQRFEFKDATEKKPCKYCKMNVCKNCGEQMKIAPVNKVIH